ncbi:hypothetical protein [Erythrobacter aurantius]|uniref:hypothetical protein n=1 Tax=Erythrobacter aurantius TaxID=2909249 RepID=UPI00207AF554|nr:hypothetical protein [Erythrobacter aurantius]
MTVRDASLALTFFALLATAACDTMPAPEPQVAASARAQPSAFIEAACGGCHAVEPPFLSPNPQAPSFEAIANRKGVTDETLGDWLADAHNYPEVMDFDLEPHHIEEVAAYMVTLRREDYVPAE